MSWSGLVPEPAPAQQAEDDTLHGYFGWHRLARLCAAIACGELGYGVHAPWIFEDTMIEDRPDSCDAKKSSFLLLRRHFKVFSLDADDAKVSRHGRSFSILVFTWLAGLQPTSSSRSFAASTLYLGPKSYNPAIQEKHHARHPGYDSLYISINLIVLLLINIIIFITINIIINIIVVD